MDKVVAIQNNRAKIGFGNLYETIRVLNYQKFVVYTLTKEQYNTLTNLIQKEGIRDIESIIGHAEGLLGYDTKDSLIRIANQNVEGVYYIDEDKCLYYSDELKKVTQYEFENMDEDTDVLYTTETFEDLISSYKIHEDIDLTKVQGPVLKKTRN